MAPDDPEAIYRQLGRLLGARPDFFTGALNHEKLEWLGRVRALVRASGDELAAVAIETGVTMLSAQRSQQAVDKIMVAAHSALAAVELQAPASIRGTFIPASNSFDAFAALTKIFGSAKADLMVVDPYLDETALTEFGGAVAPSAAYRLLADKASYKATLTVAARKWREQHGDDRPLSVRLAAPRALHDRAIFVDRSEAWILTQSLKDFAKRSPAEIVRGDDTASLKIAAYGQIWDAAEIVV